MKVEIKKARKMSIHKFLPLFVLITVPGRGADAIRKLSLRITLITDVITLYHYYLGYSDYFS